MLDLTVTLGRLSLRNLVLVASGTFGYARSFADHGALIRDAIDHHLGLDFTTPLKPLPAQ
ncbi:MAG: hypothetical protein U0746_15980 [Gemmataceae bacterium]